MIGGKEKSIWVNVRKERVEKKERKAVQESKKARKLTLQTVEMNQSWVKTNDLLNTYVNEVS